MQTAQLQSNDRLKRARQIIRRADPERRDTAYHEAGHALVASLLDIPVGHVSIRPTGTSLGRCSSASLPVKAMFDPEHGRNKTWPVDMAGIAAEKLKHPRRATWQIYYDGAYGDYDSCISYARIAYHHDRSYRASPDTENSRDEYAQGQSKRALRLAKRLLAANREKLDLHVAALLKREYLHGREVARLVTGKHQVYFDAAPCQSFFITFGADGPVSRVACFHNGNGETTQHPTLREALSPIFKTCYRTPDVWDGARQFYKVSQIDLRRVRKRLEQEASAV